MKIAVVMGLPSHQVENIRVAGLLHDIGKIEVSGEILRKVAGLTPEEKESLDEHSDKGGYILTKVGEILKEVVPISGRTPIQRPCAGPGPGQPYFRYHGLHLDRTAES